MRYGTRAGIDAASMPSVPASDSSGSQASCGGSGSPGATTPATPGDGAQQCGERRWACTSTRAPRAASVGAKRTNCSASPRPCSATSRIVRPADRCRPSAARRRQRRCGEAGDRKPRLVFAPALGVTPGGEQRERAIPVRLGRTTGRARARGERIDRRRRAHCAAGGARPRLFQATAWSGAAQARADARRSPRRGDRARRARGRGCCGTPVRAGSRSTARRAAATPRRGGRAGRG